MNAESLLVVEDDEDIRELLRYTLTNAGFRVTPVASGEEALRVMRDRPHDLVVLDLLLPGVQGLEVCRALKGDPRTQEVPILILTAKGEDPDIVAGLEAGADDYVTKPFSNRVLVARVRAVLRRASQVAVDNGQPIQRGPISVDPRRFEVVVNGEVVPLTVTEFRILWHLLRHPGWVFTRSQIVEAARGPDHPVTDRSVDVHIVGLRRKLGDAADLIETVRGVGYRFRE